jgi:predicted cupin superfamily sugar epimerase
MPRTPAAERIIAALGLTPLPGEGGFFRVTSRTPTASAIYFLITLEDFSALHRLDRDELWHFHAGDPAEHVQLDPATGDLRRVRMGPDVPAGDEPQVRVPAGSWQGARLDPAFPPHHGYALFSCTMAPPWAESGCTFGARADLQRAFPAAATLVAALTR